MCIFIYLKKKYLLNPKRMHKDKVTGIEPQGSILLSPRDDTQNPSSILTLTTIFQRLRQGLYPYRLDPLQTHKYSITMHFYKTKDRSRR